MPQEYEEEIEYWRLIHNNLDAAVACYTRQAQEKEETGDRTGIFYDWLAALIFSAFSCEAHLNFVGVHLLGDGWPERASFDEKLALLNRYKSLGLDKSKRPLQTLTAMNRLRNQWAHGKPEIGQQTRTRSKRASEEDLFSDLKSDREKQVSAEFVLRCRDDVEALRKLLYEKAEIEPFEALTRTIGTTRTISE